MSAVTPRPGAPTTPEPRLGAYATRVAVVAALVLFAAAAIVLVLGSRDAYTVRAVFDDVRGLIPGGKVTAGSIEIGRVSDVDFDESGNPVVTMEIDAPFRPRQGSFASIEAGSNVGAVNRTVDLTSGDPDGSQLESGATLGPSRTDQPVDLDLAVSTLNPRTRRNLEAVIQGLDRSTRGRGSDLNRMLRHSGTALNETANLLGEINADGEAIQTIVGDGRRVVGALARNPAELGASVEGVSQALEITANRQVELSRSIRALGPALAGGRETLQRLDAAIPNLQGLVDESIPLVERLRPVLARTPDAVDALTPFLEETRRLIRSGPETFRAQAPLLDQARPLIAELDPALDLLNPVADHLRVRTPEVAGFYQTFADLTANYDLNGHVARLSYVPIQGPRPSTSAAGEIGPSEFGPGLLASPFERTPGVLEGDPWDDYANSFIGGGRPLGDFLGGQR